MKMESGAQFWSEKKFEEERGLDDLDGVSRAWTRENHRR